MKLPLKQYKLEYQLCFHELMNIQVESNYKYLKKSINQTIMKENKVHK